MKKVKITRHDVRVEPRGRTTLTLADDEEIVTAEVRNERAVDVITVRPDSSDE